MMGTNAEVAREERNDETRRTAAAAAAAATAAATAVNAATATATAAIPALDCSVRRCPREAAVRIIQKKKKSENGDDGDDVSLLSSGTANDDVTAVCLLHYYAGSYARRIIPTHRQDLEFIEPQASLQRPIVQTVFAKVFVDLQEEIRKQEKELARESHHGRPRLRRDGSDDPSNGDHSHNDPLSDVLDRIHSMGRKGKGRAMSNGKRMMMIGGGGQGPKKKKKKPPPPPPPTIRQKLEAKAKEKDEGGYWTETAVPERIARAQEIEMERYRLLNDRVQRAAATATDTAQEEEEAAAGPASAAQTHYPSIERSNHKGGGDSSYYLKRRRRPSRRSIWNAVLDEDQKKKDERQQKLSVSKKQTTNSGAVEKEEDPSMRPALCTSSSSSGGGGTTSSRDRPGSRPNFFDAVSVIRCPGCGSTSGPELIGTRGGAAFSQGSHTKGEVWGNKDAGEESWNRYRCQGCGRVWNEDD
jgi:hypothetical protein